MSEKHKLATILFADIAGYTAIMVKDEAKALQFLAKFKKVLEAETLKTEGKIIQYYGDGCLLTFESVRDGMNCAMAVQKAFNEPLVVPVRIGMHQGEVVYRDGNVFGNGVNLASRIESLGVPGSILVSKNIRDQIRNQNEYKLTSLGMFDFKNMDEAKEVYAVANEGFVVPLRKDMQGKLKEKPEESRSIDYLFKAVMGIIALVVFYIGIKYFGNDNTTVTDNGLESLAIFPFDILSEGDDLTYLSNGIPENLINRLSEHEEIKVFSRSATFRLDKNADTYESLRNELKADYFLTGQLSKVGNNLYLNCQLTNPNTQEQKWGERISLPLGDLLSMEDSLVTLLIDPLQITLKPFKKKSGKKEIDPLAYDQYLQGRHLSYGSTPEETEKALNHFRKAIEIDPSYAKAYAAIANEKVVQMMFSTNSRSEISNEARMAAQSAIAIDPDLPEAYMVDASLKFYLEFDWGGALEAYKKALSLDPNNADIIIRYSAALVALKKYDEAIMYAEKAIKLDPISTSSLHNLGWVNFVAGKFDVAERAFNKALELHPNWIWGHIKNGFTKAYQGKNEESIAMALKAESLLPDGWGSELIQTALMLNHYKNGNKEKFNQLYAQFIEHKDNNGIKDPFTMAAIYHFSGQDEKALIWYEKSIDEKSPSTYQMNIEVLFTPEFYNSKDFQRLLKKVGFDKYQ
jgi:tetratricopeptide (TPR) repeat protein